MIGIRSFRRHRGEPDPVEDSRVIHERSSVDLLAPPRMGDGRPHVLCLDIGRSNDFSTLADLSLDPARAPYPFTMHHLWRAPHGTSHRAIAATVRQARDRLAAAGHPVIVALDVTGIGSGTGEIVELVVPLVFKVEISGGKAPKVDEFEWNRWHVPKKHLVDAVVNVTMDKRLTVARTVEPEMQAVFWEEVRGFSRLVTAAPDGSARVTYGNNAGVAKHDDTVLTVSIGVWVAEMLARQGSLTAQSFVKPGGPASNSREGQR